MKKREKRKLNNDRGFSLIEVLVAVVILAIITLPIINSFASAARINSKARQAENADTAASAVIEDFKALSIDRLKEKYPEQYQYDESTGIYTFNVTNSGLDYYEGVNGEEFAINVVLDPTAYKDVVSEDGTYENNPTNNINSYGVPNFASLNTSKNYVIRDVIYRWDMDAKGTFAIQSENYNESMIKKTLEITVDIGPADGNIDGNDIETEFVQNVSGRIIYKYSGCDDVVKEFKLEENRFMIPQTDNKYMVSADTGVKNVYLFYVPFDKYTTEFVENLTGDEWLSDTCYATDNVIINYNYNNEYSEVDYSALDVYLVQQNILSVYNRDIYLNRKNVQVNINNNEKIDLNNYGTIDLSGSIGLKGGVSIYSNIYKWDTLKSPQAVRNNGLTVNKEDAVKDYLYTITVDVWLDNDSRDENEDTLTTVISTKEN